jgi:hypothetical protein
VFILKRELFCGIEIFLSNKSIFFFLREQRRAGLEFDKQRA